MICKLTCVFRLVDKEMRTTSTPLKRNGQVVTDENGQPKMRSFVILRGAIDRPYTDAEGKKITDFHNFIAANGLGEVLFKYLDKGRKIMAVCNVETRQFKVEGKKITTPSFIIEQFCFLDPKDRTLASNNTDEQAPVDENVVPDAVLIEETESVEDDGPFTI
jgi:single-stranded DNA-binding protein